MTYPIFRNSSRLKTDYREKDIRYRVYQDKKVITQDSTIIAGATQQEKAPLKIRVCRYLRRAHGIL